VKITEITGGEMWLHETGVYCSSPFKIPHDPANKISKPTRSHDEVKARRRARQEMLKGMFPPANPDVPRPDPLFMAMRHLK